MVYEVGKEGFKLKKKNYFDNLKQLESQLNELEFMECYWRVFSGSISFDVWPLNLFLAMEPLIQMRKKKISSDS